MSCTNYTNHTNYKSREYKGKEYKSYDGLLHRTTPPKNDISQYMSVAMSDIIFSSRQIDSSKEIDQKELESICKNSKKLRTYYQKIFSENRNMVVILNLFRDIGNTTIKAIGLQGNPNKDDNEKKSNSQPEENLTSGEKKEKTLDIKISLKKLNIMEKSMLLTTPDEIREYESYVSEVKSLTFSDDKFYIVGRFHGCDIKLINNGNICSRIQFMIYIVGDTVILVDVGTLFNTKIIGRSDKEKELTESTQECRKAIIFKLNETVVIEAGQYVYTFSPKECIVCMSEPRNIKLECGHTLLCKQCYERILNSDNKKCPSCRKPITVLDNYDSCPVYQTYNNPCN